MTDFPQSGNSSNSPAFAAALQRAQLIASKIRPDADGTAAPPQLAGTTLHASCLQSFIQISLKLAADVIFPAKIFCDISKFVP